MLGQVGCCCILRTWHGVPLQQSTWFIYFRIWFLSIPRKEMDVNVIDCNRLCLFIYLIIKINCKNKKKIILLIVLILLRDIEQYKNSSPMLWSIPFDLCLQGSTIISLKDTWHNCCRTKTLINLSTWCIIRGWIMIKSKMVKVWLFLSGLLLTM